MYYIETLYGKNKKLFLLPLIILGLSVSACATNSSMTEEASFATLAQRTSPPPGLLNLCEEQQSLCVNEHVQTAISPFDSYATAGSGVEIEPTLLTSEAREAKPQLIGVKLQRTEPHEAQSSVITEIPASTLEMTPELMRTLNSVNQRINQQIVWRSDQDVYGVAEYWTLPLSNQTGREGDCEDYALEKRQALIDHGIPASALALATATSAATGYHAVLVVHTDQGDLVLDNATPWILSWAEAPYTWQTIQASGDILHWRAVLS